MKSMNFEMKSGDFVIGITTDDKNLAIETIEYEEMVEILAAIRDTPIRGNELFDSAKEKACRILKQMPVSNY